MTPTSAHVHCRLLGEVGVQLFPCGPCVAISRPFAAHPRTRITTTARRGAVGREHLFTPVIALTETVRGPRVEKV